MSEVGGFEVEGVCLRKDRYQSTSIDLELLLRDIPKRHVSDDLKGPCTRRIAYQIVPRASHFAPVPISEVCLRELGWGCRRERRKRG